VSESEEVWFTLDHDSVGRRHAVLSRSQSCRWLTLLPSPQGPHVELSPDLQSVVWGKTGASPAANPSVFGAATSISVELPEIWQVPSKVRSTSPRFAPRELGGHCGYFPATFSWGSSRISFPRLAGTIEHNRQQRPLISITHLLCFYPLYFSSSQNIVEHGFAVITWLSNLSSVCQGSLSDLRAQLAHVESSVHLGN
jgi:hypothetical protein